MNTLPTSTQPVSHLPLGSALPPSPASIAPFVATPRWQSEDLLAGADEALIAHGDQVYRLRRTGTGKLILTK